MGRVQSRAYPITQINTTRIYYIPTYHDCFRYSVAMSASTEELLEPCRFYRLQTGYTDVQFFTKYAVYYVLLRRGFTEQESFDIVHNGHRPTGLSLSTIIKPFDRNLYDQYGPVGMAEDSQGQPYYYLIEQEPICAPVPCVAVADRPCSECALPCVDPTQTQSPVKRIRFASRLHMEVYPVIQSKMNHVSCFVQPISVLFLRDVGEYRKGEIKDFSSIVHLTDRLNELSDAEILEMGFNKGKKKGLRRGDVKTAIENCPRVLGKSMRVILKDPVSSPLQGRRKDRVYYNPLHETFADVLQNFPSIKYSPTRTEGFPLRVSEGVFFPENASYRALFKDLFHSSDDADYDVRFLSLVFYLK